MTEKLEITISKTFVDGRKIEFNERTSDGMIGRLTKELDAIKNKRDTEILEAVKNINEKYNDRIYEINKKIYAKAKLLKDQ